MLRALVFAVVAVVAVVAVPAQGQNKFLTQQAGKLKGSTTAQEAAVAAEFGNQVWLLEGGTTTAYSTIGAALAAASSGFDARGSDHHGRQRQRGLDRVLVHVHG